MVLFDERAVLRASCSRLKTMASTGKKTPLVTQTTLTAQATLPQSELQARTVRLSLSRASPLTNYLHYELP